jgi:hemoglobin/transferrin/lactoferrin receptor protein
MKAIFVVTFILGLINYSYSQILTVYDKASAKPIASVIIASDKPKFNTTTDSSGKADISKLGGVARIEIRHIGYKTLIKTYSELEQSNFVCSMVISFSQFDEFVISATRWKQPSRNVPFKIATITKKDAVITNPQTAADLLGSSGEVFIQKSQQGGGSPMIRGFSANRLLYSVDGVRMNAAIFRSGNVQQVISLDPFAIESTEVLFGPGSVIYGSDAIGGVMSFHTLTAPVSKSDTTKIKGNAVSRFSSANNEFTNHVDLALSLKKWAFVTSVSHANFRDLRMGQFGPDEYLKRFYIQRIDTVDRIIENPNPLVQNPSAYSQLNIMQKLRFQPNENWDFQFGFHYSETSDFARYDRLIELDNNGLPRSAVWKYGPQIWMMNHLSITHSKKSRLYDEMTIRCAQQTFKESRIDRNFAGSQRFRLRTNEEEVLAFSTSVDFEKSTGKHQLVYGIEYVFNDVTSRGSAIDIRNSKPLSVPDRYPASQWSSLGAYMNYQFILSKKLLIQSGIRFSQFHVNSDFSRHLEFFPFDFIQSTITNGAFTGSLGINFTPSDSWKVSLNGSTGFRAPNIDDIGKIFDLSAAEVVVPNTSLKAEYAYNGELNVSKIVGDIIKIDFSGFYTFLDNAMVRRPFQVNNQDSIFFAGELSQVFAIQNAAFSNVFGLNAGFELRLSGGFSLTSRYNFQRGIEEMENGEISPSRHAAPAFGMSKLSYQRRKWNVQFYILYSEEVSFARLNQEERQKRFIYKKDFNGNPYSPDWYTFNVKALYQLNTLLSITAGVENIADRRYRPYSSGLVAPGRNYVLSLRLNY